MKMLLNPERISNVPMALKLFCSSKIESLPATEIDDDAMAMFVLALHLEMGLCFASSSCH